MISAPTLALAISVVPLGAGSKSAATGAPATLLAPSQTAVRAAVGSTLRASALVASVTASSSAGLVASGVLLPAALGDVEGDRERPRDPALRVAERHDADPVLAPGRGRAVLERAHLAPQRGPVVVEQGLALGLGDVAEHRVALRLGGRPPAEVERGAGGVAHPQLLIEHGDRRLGQAVEQAPVPAALGPPEQQRRDQGDACGRQSPG